MIKIEINDQMSGYLDEIKKRASDLKQPLQDIAFLLRDEMYQNMVDGHNNSLNINWEKPAPNNLHLSGDLKESFEILSSANEASIVSNSDYANIHNYGGTIYPKNKQYLRFKTDDDSWVTTTSVYIPRRSYFPVNEEGELSPTQNIMVAEILMDYLLELENK